MANLSSSSGGIADDDDVFDFHMGLLSINKDETRSEQKTIQTEEAKMAPLFYGPVYRSIRRMVPSNSFQLGFPQYGLLAGCLQHIDDRKQDQSKPEGVSDVRLFLNVNSPWSAFLCGSQGSGKSHTLSCMLENCLLTSQRLGEIPNPLGGLVFHYDRFSSESGNICEAAYLCSSGIQVRVLVSPSNLEPMKRAYGNIEGLPKGASRPVVMPLLLKDKHLSMENMMKLMAVKDSDGPIPLYMESLQKILREMAKTSGGGPVDYDTFERKIGLEKLDAKQNGPLKLRQDLLKSFLDRQNVNRTDIWQCEPGTLTIVDLTCPFVDESHACLLFDISLSIFLKSAGQKGIVVALDEAHQYMTDTPSAVAFTNKLKEIIRLQRHMAARIIISTQEPTISPELLDLSSMTIVHRFTSPKWMEALRSHLAGLSSMAALENGDGSDGRRQVKDIFNTIVKLSVGQALMFSPTALLGVSSDKLEKLGLGYMKVKIRQRITSDGGKSIYSN
ncbi:MAG: hypothetical protein M1837_000486 [Sclerophora amabilis]|nr:MAG: hypothetical protein M1837_000486 [Sclerophora amabilis]